MRVVLFVLAMLSFMFGIYVTATAGGAADEITGLVLFLIFSVFLTGAGIVDTLLSLRKELVNVGQAVAKK